MSINILSEMVEVQDSLCEELSEDWRAKGWDFRLAGAEEVFEAIEHLKWKWWKNPETVSEQDIDWEAVHYEVSDIFNFVTTYLLRGASNFRTSYILNESFERAKKMTMPGTAELNEGVPGIHQSLYYAKELVRDLMGSCFDEDSFNGYNASNLTGNYFALVRATGLSLERLRAIYLAKVELNIFRWNNGLKDGSYIRIWNGVKDDVFLRKIVNMTNPLDPNYCTMIQRGLENIYGQIQEQYAHVAAAIKESETIKVSSKPAYSKAPRPAHETNTPPDVA